MVTETDLNAMGTNVFPIISGEGLHVLASWPPLAAGASSRNLYPRYYRKNVKLDGEAAECCVIFFSATFQRGEDTTIMKEVYPDGT